MSRFLDAAVELAKRGFQVLPLKPRDKWPIVPGGCHAGTTDADQVRLWWTKHPDANLGISCGLSNLVVMDADHGLASYDDFISWRDRNGLPPTYTVRTGRRTEFGIQMYYSGTIKIQGRKTWRLDGVTGDFRGDGQLVVHPPSIHPESGEEYQVVCDLPIVPKPDMILALPTVEGKERTTAQTNQEGLIVGNRNEDLCSFIGIVRKHTSGLDEETCLALCLHRNERYEKGPLPEDEVTETVRKQYRLYPDVTPDPVVIVSGKALASENVDEVEELDQRLRITPIAEYPLTVWDGTLYMEFAKRAAEGNFVPLEFFIEGAMTYAGAMAAENLRGISEEITPRLYTVLLATAGLGKGTTFRRLRKLVPPRRMLDAVTDSDIPHTSASVALLARAGSEPALNDALLAWKCVCLDFEEMDRMMEKTRIEGSGGALMSIIRTLFDDTHPGITTTSERKVVAPVGYLSLLGAMTPSLWRQAMEGRDSYGSGLGGRFNLVATNVSETAATLLPLDIGDLQSALDKKLFELERNSLTIPTERPALDVLTEWWKESKGQPHYNRVNVIAHRKALHLAWMRDLPVITKEVMHEAVKLADYLVAIRGVFAATKGEDRTAIGENRVMHILKQIHPKWVGSKKVVELLDGLMSRASVFRALESLVNSGEAEKETVRRARLRPYAVYRASLT